MHLSEAGPYLRFSAKSRARLICLDRPAALNAINRQMALAITRQLRAWRDDDRVGHVVIASSAARLFVPVATFARCMDTSWKKTRMP